MTAKEQLIREIDRAPEFLVEEVLNFLLFIKIRLKQRVDDSQIVESTQNVSSQSFLDLIDEISLQIPQEEWAKLPSDMSKNLDYYLYGSPKSEE
ncbi:MAG: hypothetical protein KME31_20410 [Tolypothrix carrinoi HA7290-LM1]|jgi:hypothetical protein|nr:hypothetical protein [Tolypothrix carrinoi HA7290-LM1]